MSALWPHWLRPAWLLLLPLLLWLLWLLWQRPQRSGRWQQLLPAAFHGVLLVGGGQRSNRLPWLALGLAWLLALLALLGPSWQQVELDSRKRADPLVVVLDLSLSMLASDAPPNRLEQARRKLLDLLAARGDAQTGIVVYAGSAHSLVPLSDDLLTARNLLEALKPSIMPLPGQRADLGLAKALQLLEQGARGRGRLLLITAQLSPAEQDGIRQLLDDQAVALDILGIGTAAGAPIPQDGGGFLKDAAGSILVPRLDEAELRRFAASISGGYSNARLDDADLRGLGLLDGTQSLREAGEPTRLQLWADAGHWLLLPLLLLAACAGRRGWLFCLPLLLVLPQPSQAFEFEDLWLRPDQQGQRLLQAEEPAAAAERFEDPQWQGLALYQAGDFAAAASRFTLGDSAADHYNRGNALARAGELEAALDAYDTALERQPNLAQARANRALVEELLRQQKQQQQQEQQEDQQESDPPPQQSQAAQANPQGSTAEKSDGPGEQAPPEATTAADAAPSQPTDATGDSAATAAAEDSPATRSQAADQAPASAASRAEEPMPAASAGQDDSRGTADATRSAPDASLPTADGKTPGSGATEAPELDDERRQALEQWLRQIPDDPAELLRRKFWYEQQQLQLQENSP